MHIAIIPARCGSKRIPNKNIRNFHGRPMISYAISVALDSGLFEHIVVSTDDVGIAETAKAMGAEVPFLRPADIADDLTPTVPVVAHAIEQCITKGWSAEYVCCIYPAVPLLHPDDLASSLELLKASRSDYSFPVTEFPSPPQRALKKVADGGMASIWPEFENYRTQDLEEAFFDCGQFYWGRSAAWIGQQGIHNNSIGYTIPSWRVVDIDTMEDWDRAEILYQTYSGAIND